LDTSIITSSTLRPWRAAAAVMAAISSQRAVRRAARGGHDLRLHQRRLGRGRQDGGAQGCGRADLSAEGGGDAAAGLVGLGQDHQRRTGRAGAGQGQGDAMQVGARGRQDGLQARQILEAHQPGQLGADPLQFLAVELGLGALDHRFRQAPGQALDGGEGGGGDGRGGG
jgi:hypothetical protein